jgi:heme-degrading monooxygenase HmoA
MPALPWKRIGEVGPDTELTMMASRLPLQSRLRIPGFMTATLRIRRQLAEAPGLVGYALDAELFAKTFWTVSAWRSNEQLEAFAATDPHRSDVERVRSHMDPTTFVFWTATAGDLPIGWDEVRRRIEAARSAESG